MYIGNDSIPSWLIKGFFKFFGFDLDELLSSTGTTTGTYNYTFTNGKAKDKNGIDVNLLTYIEPTNNTQKQAYLYRHHSMSLPG